ncbi:MAG: MerR family transcriptional regulator [Proteobacteria bacterium]|nr:MerR family transcriptional regulator [Pseudomonadota bacterium]MBU1742965.1 MerR family transcriptional regulator [Pseudomonadota bacterium]
MTDQPTWTISQLAREMGISPRSIRFYEEKGLLSPRRTNGGYRIYTKRDRARLKLIRRGKRFGLTLDECAEILGLASVDLDEAEQIRKALDYGERILADVDRRLGDLKAMRRDLLQIETRMRGRLAALEAGRPKRPSRGRSAPGP